MRIGKLNRRITIRRDEGITRNAMNEGVEGFQDFAKFWAEEVQQKPTEAWKAGQTAAQVETVFRLHWLKRASTITPSDRLISNGREYEIIGATEPVRRKIIEIAAIAYNSNQQEEV